MPRNQIEVPGNDLWPGTWFRMRFIFWFSSFRRWLSTAEFQKSFRDYRKT